MLANTIGVIFPDRIKGEPTLSTIYEFKSTVTQGISLEREKKKLLQLSNFFVSKKLIVCISPNFVIVRLIFKY